MYLIDTSVWIEHFRSPPRVDLTAFGDFDDFVVCLPVVQEVLQGIDRDAAFVRVRTALLAMPLVEAPMESSLIEEAVDLYRRARRAGVTLRSSVDCLIAACALRHHLTVLHHDRDFTALAGVSMLEAQQVPLIGILALSDFEPRRQRKS